MIIKVENVSKIIRGNSVIEHISMELTSGKVFGFRGINGSGKTMLMRLIAGLIYPTKGQITVDNKILGRDINFPENMYRMNVKARYCQKIKSSINIHI